MVISSTFFHLLDFCHISDESVIIYKVQKLLQLIQVTDVILSNPLDQNTDNKNVKHAHEHVL